MHLKTIETPIESCRYLKERSILQPLCFHTGYLAIIAPFFETNNYPCTGSPALKAQSRFSRLGSQAHLDYSPGRESKMFVFRHWRSRNSIFPHSGTGGNRKCNLLVKNSLGRWVAVATPVKTKSHASLRVRCTDISVLAGCISAWDHCLGASRPASECNKILPPPGPDRGGYVGSSCVCTCENARVPGFRGHSPLFSPFSPASSFPPTVSSDTRWIEGPAWKKTIEDDFYGSL